MRKDPLNTPLTDEEQKFATDNHYLVFKYLRLRKLPPDEWYDVVIFRYLRSVKRWFAYPELHNTTLKSLPFTLCVRQSVMSWISRNGGCRPSA